MKRLVLLLRTQGELNLDFALPAPDLFLVYLDETSLRECVLLATGLRALGFYAHVDYERRSLRAQLRLANRLNSRFSCVVGQEEVSSGRLRLKRMSDGAEFEAEAADISTILDGEEERA